MSESNELKPNAQLVCDYLNQFLLAAHREPVTPDNVIMCEQGRADVRLTQYQYVPLLEVLRERFGAPIAYAPTVRYLKREWKFTEARSIVVSRSLDEVRARYTVHLTDLGVV